MNKIKNEINSEALSLENISDDFRSIMKPSQTAALLLGVEKSKNQNRFSVSKLFLGENLVLNIFLIFLIKIYFKGR